MSFIVLESLKCFLKVTLNLQEVSPEDLVKPGPLKRLYNFINAVKELEEPEKIEEEPEKKTPEGLGNMMNNKLV